ncbi:hypothetical protein GCM10022286_28870 [Gryllotalpicola daejeonensis]|uniref:DUF2304 domain-containing protein n=1 Tax=Gryllotalpicola daejeonensis TaxID=993087 RepID=A0ABP7ZN75_9MICO
MEAQLLIKIVLIVAFVAFAVFLMLPTRSVRHVALRRIVLVIVLALAVLAVVFPNVLTTVAHLVGIGRGTDLLLYGLIVVFLGNALVMQRRSTYIEKQVTVLARRIALLEAPQAAGDVADGIASADIAPSETAPDADDRPGGAE